MANGVFLYTDQFQGYDMGPQHPLKPIRLRRTYDLLNSYNAFEHVPVQEPRSCTAEDLQTVHSGDYVDAVDRMSAGDHVPMPWTYGFGHGDNPAFPGMWEAGLLYAGASIHAADLVIGGCDVAMNISGGLHHAHRGRAAGFCLFNDGALALVRLRTRYDRVAYVDIDVHHGDGVQEAFYEDPSVLTVSIHQHGHTLFPGTGDVREIGRGRGEGFSVNVPMWPSSDDSVWLDAWRRAVLPILEAYNPEAICLQLGCDAHFKDPLAQLHLTSYGWLQAVKDIKALGKPIVAVGGGGYNQISVPRLWALAFGCLFDVELSDETPECFMWRELIPTLHDHDQPAIAEHDLEYARGMAHSTVNEVREKLFRYHGL